MWSARAVAFTLLAGVAVYVAIVFPLAARGVPWWALVLGIVAFYAAAIALLVAAYFTLAWLYRSPRPPDARIGIAGTLRLVWFEYWTLSGAAFRMLFYRHFVPDPAPRAATLPVLLVHGVLCNAGVWATLARWLRTQGIGPVYGL